MPGSYVNHPAVIAQNDNMISINTTLNVDLTGQCASESIGSLQYSGSGGQSDTAIGALHAKNGWNIIAVKSVAHTKQGDVSAINAQLPKGSVVTLSRNDIDYIVTEYGIAPMRGRSVRERVNNLIAVAHPDYREQLHREAQDYLMSQAELENKIATLTGGRAAEELIFHSASTGASNDIEQATKLARAMITRYGMSQDFDMVALVKRQHEKATKILEENETKLHELSKYLYEKETITGDEFMEILNRKSEN